MRNNLLNVFGLSSLLLAGCASAPFAPVENPNPWADDYKNVAAMENYRKWGTYNVHDPACKKIGDYYYMYSTDAIFMEDKKEAQSKGVPMGYIQIRRSKDLVNWEFLGWAFPEIPAEAVAWVHEHADGKGATNIWAPYIVPYGHKFRLYYCVSAFGLSTSYIGMAEGETPQGPWKQMGCVVKTDKTTAMNAIDPSIIQDDATGRMWMHYGSYFGGLYCVELNPATGLPMKEGDLGHLIARRANYRRDNLEAPEIIYSPEQKQYYLFGSYDPLMTTYNVRVFRSDKPEGPFTDYFGKQVADTTNNFPILTAPYRFKNHPGWAGTAHCGIIRTDDGRLFMAHQGRLSPHNVMMDLHVRQVFFTEDGWPVVSPERYAATEPRSFKQTDLVGLWEIIRIQEPLHERQLAAGQVLWGEGQLRNEEWNESLQKELKADGKIKDTDKPATSEGDWTFDEKKQLLSLTLGDEFVKNLIIFAGQDWENEQETVLFTGLDSRGRSVWGKRVK